MTSPTGSKSAPASAPADELLAQLNPEQAAAAAAPDGPILVLAAAGTGKTRTLVFRVAHLVRRGIPPDRILLLTFTNKAAKEMLERARAIVGDGVGGIWGGTFHHLANRLLRRHATRLGFGSDYVILDRDDARGLVAGCLKKLRLDRQEFPRPAVLLSLFSAVTNVEGDLKAVVGQQFDDPETAASVLAVAEAYAERKHELGAMDFDDLLVNGLRLLADHSDIRERYQAQFAHVLVDEYQDTNSIQATLVDLLGAVSRNVFVVGDDFQSIYSWRGADFRNIMTFPERYPNARLFKLETNYRSVPEILSVANACIAGNPEQFQKVLRATRESLARPVLARVRDGEDQARYVAEAITSCRREGYRLSDIAVLYRAHYHALDLERLLPRMQVPYIITSGVRFFEQAHIKDVLSLLRLCASPTDELAFARLLRLLPGVGPRTAEKLWDRMTRRFEPAVPASWKTVGEGLPVGARAPWGRIAAVFDDPVSAESGAAVVEAFTEAFYAEHANNTFEEAQHRLDDIAALAEDVARFDRLEDFLSDVALLTNLDADLAAEEDGAKDCVRLSTVHQAKGLEWPVVIVLWAIEGMFPSSRSLEESDEGEAEERRLFYVAVTRAKDILVICTPEVRRMRDGGVMYCLPSRFVTELPGDLLSRSQTGFL